MRNSHVMVVSTLHEWPIITLIRKFSCHRAVPANGGGGGGGGVVMWALPRCNITTQKNMTTQFLLIMSLQI